MCSGIVSNSFFWQILKETHQHYWWPKLGLNNCVFCLSASSATALPFIFTIALKLSQCTREIFWKTRCRRTMIRVSIELWFLVIVWFYLVAYWTPVSLASVIKLELYIHCYFWLVAWLKADKKNIRLCGDFEVMVNPVAKLDRYPVPARDLFITLKRDRLFTNLIFVTRTSNCRSKRTPRSTSL